ncbi:MAG TPA: SDR family NAD(P)-dependent oxidoreductase [Acidimicrobiales bacterium]|jgi:2-hydroxycyclohexanecarboxyl-CoA dehydrogenase|nr:SDR family NAD(P)-dependent oxidoreductase [Acidimicrobiales bacterium]
MGRVAVVTGGASGIGLAICHHLAGSGCHIAVLDVDGDAAEEAATGLRRSDVPAVAVPVDVADGDSVVKAMDRTRQRLGPISILVTSAGIAPFEPFESISLESWNRVLAVNLTGTFLCVQAAVPDMVAAEWGRIVTISSSSAQTGAPRMGHYVASKGGVIALTRSLAREYGAHGITVNTIPPSSIDTPMMDDARQAGHLTDNAAIVARTPVGRIGTPDDIAATCAFLCSDTAGYISGQVIGVNGGSVIS